MEYPINSVVLPASLLAVILRDYETRHHPNEYCFFLSGKLKTDGVAEIENYYPSEMDVQAPTLCKCSEPYTQAVTYDWSPSSHVVLVWAHVQPCANLSSLDAALFAKVAAWDTAHGESAGKRSIAMTIDSLTYDVRFYDVATLSVLPHTLIQEVSHV